MATNPVISDLIDFGTPDSVYEATPIPVNSTLDFELTAKLNGEILDLTDTQVYLVIKGPNNSLQNLIATVTDAENGKALYTVGFNDLKKVGGLGESETWIRQWQYRKETPPDPATGAISEPFEFQLYS